MSTLPGDPSPSGGGPPPLPPANAAGASDPAAQPPPLPRPAGTCSEKLVAGLMVVGFILFINLMSWKLAFLIGLGLAVTGGWLAKREHEWLTAAQVVPGTVVELVRSTSSRHGYSYAPRIRYTSRNGTVADFVRPYYSKPAGFTVGESVFLAYDSAHPKDKRIVTFGSRYGFASFVLVLGLSVSLLAATMVIGRTVVPRIYTQGRLPEAAPSGW